MSKKTKVLIVDDSKAIRMFLKEVLDKDPTIEVVSTAEDPFEAREQIKLYNPDVITLDIEMPKMDGITFLKNLMRLRPMPVVMISSLTEAGANVTLEALKIGAIDYIAKQQPTNEEEMTNYISEIRYKVKYASLVDVTKQVSETPDKKKNTELELIKKKLEKSKSVNDNINKIITIGASTGGPEAIRKLLKSVNLPNCAVIIIQHMPDRFIPSFAKSLDLDSSFNVKPLETNDKIEAGHAYIAPGQRAFTLKKTTANDYLCTVHSTELKPATDGDLTCINAGFNSFAKLLGDLNISILLTGMGRDGADGLKNIRTIGGATIVQDKATSAVWGMPGSAVKLDAVDAILPLQRIGPALEGLLS